MKWVGSGPPSIVGAVLLMVVVAGCAAEPPGETPTVVTDEREPPIGVEPGGSGRNMNWTRGGVELETAEAPGILTAKLIEGGGKLLHKPKQTGDACPGTSEVTPRWVSFSVKGADGTPRDFRVEWSRNGAREFRWQRYIDGAWWEFSACFPGQDVPPSRKGDGIAEELWGTLDGEMQLVFTKDGVEGSCEVAGFEIEFP